MISTWLPHLDGGRGCNLPEPLLGGVDGADHGTGARIHEKSGPTTGNALDPTRIPGEKEIIFFSLFQLEFGNPGTTSRGTFWFHLYCRE